MNTFKKNNQGFTLVELLVSVSIFSFLVLIVSGIFIRSLSAEKKLGITQKVQSDSRVMFNRMIDDIKTKKIAYQYAGYSGGVNISVTELALVDENDNIIVYRQGASVCPDSSSSPCVEYSDDGGVSWIALTSKDVKVNSLRFFIQPLIDPFTRGGAGYLSDRQPSVGIVMRMGSAVEKEGVSSSLLLQTTVSSRVYQR